MCFPLLFMAGMTLADTADGVLMLGVYRWAFVKPIRKLFYNLTITLISVLVAFIIGAVEALGLIGERLGLEGWFWELVAGANEQMAFFGFIIVGVFAGVWGLSALIYRLGGYDRLEIKIQA
jgi:high-affinity nickel-transport protein